MKRFTDKQFYNENNIDEVIELHTMNKIPRDQYSYLMEFMLAVFTSVITYRGKMTLHQRIEHYTEKHKMSELEYLFYKDVCAALDNGINTNFYKYLYIDTSYANRTSFKKPIYFKAKNSATVEFSKLIDTLGVENFLILIKILYMIKH